MAPPLLVDLQTYQVVLLSLVVCGLVPAFFEIALKIPRLGRILNGMAGVEPAMIGSIGLLFGLFAAFLANDIWTRQETARVAVVSEAEGIQRMMRLADGLATGEAKLIKNALAAHIKLAMEEDWPAMLDGRISPKSSAKVGEISAAIITFEVGKSEGPEFQGRLLDAFNDIRTNWSLRSRMAEDRRITIKWYGVLLFGFLTQVAIAVVHIARLRAMFVAQSIFGLAFASLCAIMFINEFPFSRLTPISPAPLVTALHLLQGK